MITKTFFSKIEKLSENLNREVTELSEKDENMIFISEKVLMKIDETVREMKSIVTDHIFESMADEVRFFKTLKPLFISKLIYYSKVLSIETVKPAGGPKEIRKYYETELSKLKQYYAVNKEFYRYYRRNASYLDHKYFVRKSYDLKMELSADFYDFDENFTTSHDSKISQIIANQNLETYLLNTINSIGQLSVSNNSKFTLIWSASKVSLVELLYALHQTHCFNGGNIEFTEVIKATEKLFELDLGNPYKTIAEIRDRKNGRTKFLQLLNNNLNQLFIDSDE